MSKKLHLAPLADVQIEIMNIVWDRREVTVGEVWKAISENREVHRNTIQTMITRLDEKGWLRHRVDGTVYRYSATYPRERAMQTMVGRLVETAFGGSAEGLVLALVEGRGVTKEEADRIRAIIKKAEGTTK
jgi:BlaI family transcriptional regulator, penicillinase repressor